MYSHILVCNCIEIETRAYNLVSLWHATTRYECICRINAMKMPNYNTNVDIYCAAGCKYRHFIWLFNVPSVWNTLERRRVRREWDCNWSSKMRCGFSIQQLSMCVCASCWRSSRIASVVVQISSRCSMQHARVLCMPHEAAAAVCKQETRSSLSLGQLKGLNECHSNWFCHNWVTCCMQHAANNDYNAAVKSLVVKVLLACAVEIVWMNERK